MWNWRDFALPETLRSLTTRRGRNWVETMTDQSDTAFWVKVWLCFICLALTVGVFLLRDILYALRDIAEKMP